MDVIFNIGKSLLFVGFIYWWVAKAPENLKYHVKSILMSIMIFIYTSINAGLELIKLLTVTLYFLGRLGTLLVLSTALFFIVNEALRIHGFESYSNSLIYQQWLDLFAKPYSWAALAAIVASTSAINQILKYELDFSEYLEKQKEKLEKSK
jgi:hypothetical protein